MLQVNDFRETKVYQEAFEEGFEQGIKRSYVKAFKLGFDAGMKECAVMVARRMLANKLSSHQIEELTGLSLATINRLKKQRGL
jgi:predicted transposase/invertase (TIGR01784 family)